MKNIALLINVGQIVYNNKKKEFEAVTLELFTKIHNLESNQIDHEFEPAQLNIFWVKSVFEFEIKNPAHPNIYKNDHGATIRSASGAHKFLSDHHSSGRNATRLELETVNELIEYIKFCTGKISFFTSEDTIKINEKFKKTLEEQKSII